MASILVIDDRQDLGDNTIAALRSAGHTAELVCEEDEGAFYDKIRNEHFADGKVWDAIVLDIHFDSDHWGGVWLYNKLAKYHRSNWKHTIVYSKYSGVALRAATAEAGDLFRLRIFADTAGISDDCVLDNVTGGRAKLVKKLHDLGMKTNH